MPTNITGFFIISGFGKKIITRQQNTYYGQVKYHIML